MEFCDVCENMLFLTPPSDDQPLMHACKKCGFEKDVDTNVIYSMSLLKKEQHYTSAINQYTKLDPTLPRIDTIPCPKEGCMNGPSDGPLSRGIVYVRYDDVELKYVYICPLCDTVWKNNKKK